MLNKMCCFSVVIIFAFLSFYVNSQNTVMDYDGNVYNAITIGNQIWMKENLKVTHYNNGDIIPNITDSTAWHTLTTGALCDYNNNSANSEVYGKLYNWYTVEDNRKVCPLGWHVPSDSEWNILEKELDNSVDTTATGWRGTDIGGVLKASDTTYWEYPNSGATNSSGFSALPGGERGFEGVFYYDQRGFGYWWTSSLDEKYAWHRRLAFTSAEIYKSSSFRSSGHSIRCIKNIPTAIGQIDIYNNNFKIYPNPADNYIDVHTDEISDEIKIYDMTGKCVYKNNLIKGGNQLDISQLANGSYIIELAKEKSMGRKLFIKN